MNKIIIYLSILIKLIFSLECIVGENFCIKCDNKNKLCIQCKNDIFTPDDKGGCMGIKKCTIGENYCDKCNIEGNLCQSCEIGFYPDSNGGCSYFENCEISYKGSCFQCEENFILIGKDEEFKFCKSKYSSDLKNCKIINKENGVCDLCEDDYFLGQGDFKCTETENCYESMFGTCVKCIDGYYLDRSNDGCFFKENQFQNCEQTINGETCDICDNNYFLSEDFFCLETNFCLETKDYKCTQCIKNYYLAENGNCSFTDKCKKSKGESGTCLECLKEYYLDLNDDKCKSNEFDEEYKFCKKFNEICIECTDNYYLGEDKKCSTTKNCAESEDGICLICTKDYYLGNDSKCIKSKNVENCISYNDNNDCIECEDNYILVNKTCKIIDDENLINCKEADDKSKICTLCKNDFYLNITDNLCYSNKEFGQFYKCKKTLDTGNICGQCLPGFYLGYSDKKCTHTAGCVSSNIYNECNKCDSDFFCLSLLNNTCEKNEYISNENEMIFYKCLITNENATSCEICKSGFEVGINGLCFNLADCDIYDNGNCTKCIEKNFYNFELCLNELFGCVETSVKNCLRCDDHIDFEVCTECYEGYKLTENNYCEKILD